MSGSDSPTFFHGQPWSSWIERIGRDKPLSDDENEAQPSTSVTRLSAEDIDLYGFCPERDTFYGVVCEICNAIVKPQALIQHMESRHPSGTANFPPPTTPTTKAPVKTPYCKVSKLKKSQSSPQPTVVATTATTAAPLTSSSSTPVAATVASTGSSKLNHTSVKRTAEQANITTSLSTPLPPSSSPRSPLESISLQNTNTGGSTVATSPVKSPGNTGQPRRKRLKTDRSLLKDREYDPDRHCGVWNDETGKPCTRSLTCKAHTVSLRRTVIGRSKTFDKLLAEHRASKELPTRPTKLTLTGTVTLSTATSNLNRSLTHNSTAADSDAPSSPPVLSLPDTYPLPKAVDLLYRCLAPHGSTKPTKFEDDFANEELRSLESSLVNSTGSSQSSTTMAPISVVLPSLSPLPSTAEDLPTLALVSSPTTSTMPHVTAAALPTSCAHTLQPPPSLTPTSSPSLNSAATTPSSSIPVVSATSTLAITPTSSALSSTACAPVSSASASSSAVTPLTVTTVLDTDAPMDVDSQAAMSLYSPMYKVVQLPRANNTVHSPVSRGYQVQASMPSLSIFEPVEQHDQLNHTDHHLDHLEPRHPTQINGKRLNHASHSNHSGALVQRKTKKIKLEFQQDLSTAIQVEATTTSTPYPHFSEIPWSNCHPEPLAVTRWLRISSSRKQYNFNIH